MTVLEMHEAVKLGLDKSSSLELPAFEPEELDYWLNEAQLQLVKQKMYGNNFRGEGFEDSGKRIDDLNPLVKDSGALSVSGGKLTDHPYYPNVQQVSISSIGDSGTKYMFFVSAIAEYTTVDNKTVGAYPILQNQIKNFIQTEFNTPFIKEPLVFFYDNKIGFIRDPYKVIESVYIKYIKEPKKLVRYSEDIIDYDTIESELPEQVHPEIVYLTVNLLLENIESTRLQNHLMQLSKKE